jgi:putative heme-binding domain-containing protein
MLSELGRMLGASRPRDDWAGIVRHIVADPRGFTPIEQAALLTGLAAATRARLAASDSGDILSAWLDRGDGRSDLGASIRALVAAMKPIAADRAQPIERRRTAVGLLAYAGFDQAGEVLLHLVDPHEPSGLEAAAVRALTTHRDARVAESLLAAGRFATYPPSLRDEVLSALFAHSDHLPGLLSALEDGRVPIGAIDAQHRRSLARRPDADIRRRAEKLFGAVQGDRAKVYAAYKDVLALEANPARGRAVFRRECAQCHRLDQEGSAVGPDLFGIRNQPKEAILLHLLIPDLEITPGFAAYTVATRDGRVLTGLITSETPASLTLRQPLAKEDTILRGEVEEISASQQSLMPQGLEKTITRQEFADLLAYLKGEGGPPAETTP